MDVVTSSNVLECWSLRACASSTRGNAVANVCDDAGNNCADFVTDATTGDLVFQTLGANNCSTSGTCQVWKIYGQKAGCTLTSYGSSDQTRRLRLTANAHNSKAGGAETNATTRFYDMANNCYASTNQPVTTSVVYYRTNTSGDSILRSINSNPNVKAGSANTVTGNCGGGDSSATANDNALNAVQLICNGASSFINVNGSSTSVTNGSASYNGTTGVYVGGSWNGYWFESLLLSVGLSDPTGAAALGSNQTGYW